MNYGEYQIPLLIGKRRNKENPLHIDVDRYAGVAFFIDGEEGKVATCKHIIEMVQEDEVLLGKNLISGEIDVLYNIKAHPLFDFATAQFFKHNSYRTFPILDREYDPGYDVRAFGFTNVGRDGGNVKVNARMLKGYIVSHADESEHPQARTKNEISFPSLKGFSGSALVSEQNGALVGMLFSNHESSIEIHSFTDLEGNGEQFKESIYRIIELGLAHSAKDIIQFIEDLS